LDSSAFLGPEECGFFKVWAVVIVDLLISCTIVLTIIIVHGYLMLIVNYRNRQFNLFFTFSYLVLRNHLLILLPFSERVFYLTGSVGDSFFIKNAPYDMIQFFNFQIMVVDACY
jgi:hypothetical protein